MRERTFGALILVHRERDWSTVGVPDALFVCSEMFLGLDDIEQRRWRLWRVRQSLRQASLPVATLAQFLEPADIAWIEASAAHIAHNWYLDEGRDWTEYRGVSLGRCCENEIKGRSVRLLKFSRTVRRLQARYPNAAIYSDHEDGSAEAQLLADLGVVTLPLTTLESDDAPGARPAGHSIRSSFKAIARKWGQRGLRRVSGLLKRIRPSDKPVIVVCPSIQSLKMLECWLVQVPRRAQMSIWSTSTRPALMLALMKAGATFVDPDNGASLEAPETARRITEEWAASGARYDLLKHTYLPVQRTFHRLFDTAVRDRCPNLARVVDNATSALQQERADLLVLPNDVAGLTRAWALAARVLGTKSLTVQHGHLEYVEDENHMVADFSAFWSDMVVDQFASLGLQREQMVVTGCPHIDSPRPIARGGPNLPGAATRVLIVTTGSPAIQAYTDETWVSDYIVRVLSDLCEGPEQFHITVRLHPGESVELYEQHVKPWRHKVARLGVDGALADWLAHCDVVVSPPSTVVVEARAIGLPVVLLPIPSVDRRPTTLRQLDGVLTVDEGQSVSAAIQQLERMGFRGPANEKPVEALVGPQDGRGALRLLAAAEDIALRRNGHS